MVYLVGSVYDDGYMFIRKFEPIIFTEQGYSQLKEKLETLLVKRERVLIELQRAREQGDLSENGAYKAARFELGDTDRAIRTLQNHIKYGKVLQTPINGTIGVGSKVKLRRGDGKEFNYVIVGTFEADPMNGKISIESPMGKKLIGKRVDEVIEVNGQTYTVTN